MFLRVTLFFSSFSYLIQVNTGIYVLFPTHCINLINSNKGYESNKIRRNVRRFREQYFERKENCRSSRRTGNCGGFRTGGHHRQADKHVEMAAAGDAAYEKSSAKLFTAMWK